MARWPRASSKPQTGRGLSRKWPGWACGQSVLRKRPAAGAGTGFALPAALAALSFRKRSAKVSGRELENFTRLLSSLLAAGVPLSRALVILYKESSSPAASAKWKEIHDLVVDGMSLADSMGKSPETFPRVYTAMVQAGETGGFLDLVLAQIADFQAREKELRSKVMSAMLYPSILFCLAIGVLIFLLTFFIPRFQGIFKGFGATLPLATQIVIGVSNVVRGYGAFVAVGLVVVGLPAADVVLVGKGPADLGGPDAALAGPGPAGGGVCHGAVLPDAGHAARARACRWCKG